MRYEIDQSGKIEDTARNSVLAYSNSHAGAIILISKDKRRLQERFRRCGIPRLYVDYVFSSLLVLLIKPLVQNDVRKFIVDIEYPGHTTIIGKHVQKLVPITIEWKLIGKGSKAHDVAYKALKKKCVVGKRAPLEDVWRVANKIAGGYLNAGLSPANRHPAPASARSVSHSLKKSRKRRGRE